MRSFPETSLYIFVIALSCRVKNNILATKYFRFSGFEDEELAVIAATNLISFIALTGSSRVDADNTRIIQSFCLEMPSLESAQPVIGREEINIIISEFDAINLAEMLQHFEFDEII